MIELTKNQATDVSRMSFLPQMSDNLAQIGAAAALASRYADPTHVYPLAECSSEAMVGNAVDTIV